MQKKIAIIGAGGKTTALGLLARQSGGQSVLVTTTTHMYPFTPAECRECLIDPTARELQTALTLPGIVCAGSRAGKGKLGILPEEILYEGIKEADFVLYEADGAHHHPLKLHRPDEPVLLPDTQQCLLIAGLSALGKSVKDAVHRYELYPQWRENPQHIIGREEFLSCVLENAASSGYPQNLIKVFLNQEDLLPNPKLAQELAEALRSHGLDTRFGSLQKNPDSLLDWIIG